MSQIDMLNYQVFEEILRERANYYSESNRPVDFWVLIAPEFLEEPIRKKRLERTTFFNNHKEEILDAMGSKYYSSVISADKEFITWIRLRLGYFENIDILETQKDIIGDYDSVVIADGVCGEITLSSEDINFRLPLEDNRNFVHPLIRATQFQRMIEIMNSFMLQQSEIEGEDEPDIIKYDFLVESSNHLDLPDDFEIDKDSFKIPGDGGKRP